MSSESKDVEASIDNINLLPTKLLQATEADSVQEKDSIRLQLQEVENRINDCLTGNSNSEIVVDTVLQVTKPGEEGNDGEVNEIKDVEHDEDTDSKIIKVDEDPPVDLGSNNDGDMKRFIQFFMCFGWALFLLALVLFVAEMVKRDVWKF